MSIFRLGGEPGPKAKSEFVDAIECKLALKGKLVSYIKLRNQKPAWAGFWLAVLRWE